MFLQLNHILRSVFLISVLSEAFSISCNQNPASRTFRLGNITPAILSDGPIVISQNLFSVPANAVKRSYASLFRSAFPLTWSSNIPLFDTPNARILVDAGSSASPQFSFLQRSGQLGRNLDAIGASASSIDFIFITHGHPDHVGGLINPDGSRVFPNAVVVVGRTEHNFWLSVPPPFPGNVTVPNSTVRFAQAYRRSLRPYSNSLMLMESGQSPVPGFTFREVPGHTPGHMVIDVTYGTDRLIVAGDSFLTQPDQINNPEWGFGLEFNSTQAFSTRMPLLDELANNRTLTISYHEAFPGLGHIRKLRGNSFDWVPAVPQLIGTGVSRTCASFSASTPFVNSTL